MRKTEEKKNCAKHGSLESITVYLNSLKVSKYNPRWDIGNINSLEEDIEERGLRNKIVVIDENGSYAVLLGRKRYNALIDIAKKENNLETKKFNCYLLKGKLDTLQIMGEAMTVDNLNEPLKWYEQGKVYYNLRFKDGYKWIEISKEMKVSESVIRQKAMAYSLIEEKIISKEDLMEYLSNYKVAYQIAILKYRRNVISFYDKSKEQYFLRKERKALIRAVINYLKENPKNKINKENIVKRIINAGNMIYRFNVLEMTHKGVYEMLYDFWYPKRYLENSFKDMKEEMDLRMGHSHTAEYYEDADKMSVEEAKQKAKEKHGEYLGIKTFRRHIIYGLKRTAKEIRKKYEN